MKKFIEVYKDKIWLLKSPTKKGWWAVDIINDEIIGIYGFSPNMAVEDLLEKRDKLTN